MIYSIFAVFIGAGFGALLRWWLSIGFNAIFPAIPLGTLSANWLGAYLIGVAIAYFSLRTNLAPEWRLFIITGFMGGLTTFSTFSVEVVSHFLVGEWRYGFIIMCLHLFGSLILTALGIWSARTLFF